MKHSVLCLSSVLIALISSVCNSSAMALDPPSHDTLAYTHELKPMPQAYQLARATFLPEASKTDFKFSGNTTEGDYNQATSCEDKSKLYTTSNCKYPRAVVAASRCPFLAGYYTECKCLSQFNKTSCTAPYILGGTSCDGKYEKCVCPATVSLTYANDKCTQYCDGKCIKKSCTPTANQSNCTNGTQNCDNGCGQNTRKCCVACTHKITTKPANSSYTYSSCNDGSGSHQIQSGWKCNTGYHEKNGGCEKDCIANTCSGYTLAGCPTNAICATCSKQTTTCGGGATMNKITGCKSGYKDCNGTCIASSTCCGGCPSGKKCENGTCVATLSVGDILYSDKTTSSDVIPGKTPIGVVFDVNRKLAIALKENSSTLKWSSKYYDIPGLTNYTSESEAKGDYNGKSNTSIIRAHGDSNGYETPAADYCYNYTTTGTNKGDWYLPAAGELQLIYLNKDILNNSLSKVGGTEVQTVYYWSSSECNSNAWALTFFNGYWSCNFHFKDYYDNVRPVLAF